MSKRPCASEGCRRNVGQRNKSGLCNEHWLTTLTHRSCRTCGEYITAHNVSGYCINHRPNQARRCSVCNKTKIERNSKSGKCLDCLRPIRSIPADRRDDYVRIFKKAGNAQAAAEWILSGKPVPPPAAPRKCVTIQPMDVIRTVSAELSLTPQNVVSDNRAYEFVHARATIATILHRHGMGYAAIGRRIGRDHSTVMHLIREFPKYARRDARLDRVVSQASKTPTPIQERA